MNSAAITGYVAVLHERQNRKLFFFQVDTSFRYYLLSKYSRIELADWILE
ncbi:hypothetical protein VCR31J2_1270643 [Vibrio coralliirubri]|uniref:Uncharacterized protein n=1 Tax=Vibrio coralliirubri TaxID=1516159 RepID=A0AA87BZC1_9VIBR|nr:hypothetical protein VCR31J2_1270643 [Vibrio coralliirubri]